MSGDNNDPKFTLFIQFKPEGPCFFGALPESNEQRLEMQKVLEVFASNEMVRTGVWTMGGSRKMDFNCHDDCVNHVGIGFWPEDKEFRIQHDFEDVVKFALAMVQATTHLHDHPEKILDIVGFKPVGRPV